MRLALMVFLVVAVPTLARANVFEVRDVPVDATAASAAEARDLALAQGQREAFYRLLKRLTPDDQHALLPNLDAETISTYVRDFSVSGEKTSSVRYLARLHVRFKDGDVRLLLNEFGLPFAETMSKPAVVLPLFRRGGDATLWRDPNPWRAAWASHVMPKAPVPLLLPVGDLDDIAQINAAQIMQNDTSALAAVARRYDAGATIVVRADLAAIGAPHIELTISRHDLTSDSDSVLLRVEAGGGETVDTALARAVSVAIKAIEESWKQKNLMRFDEGGILAVSVPLKSLDHWLAIRRRLDDIAVIDRSDLILLSREEALLNIHYIGTTDQLSRALAQTDLTLWQEQGVWSLRAAGERQGAGIGSTP